MGLGCCILGLWENPFVTMFSVIGLDMALAGPAELVFLSTMAPKVVGWLSMSMESSR
jgi:hypothetical protein